MTTIIIKQVDAFNWIKVNHTSKVINRKKYDTATAELKFWAYTETEESEIGEWGYHKAVFLFQKHSGEFFSYEVGFDSISFDKFLLIAKSLLKPLSEDEAKDFVEKYGNCSSYEDIFGDAEG